MPERDFQNFDDPDLKAAIARAMPVENAPAALRDRIERLFAEQSQPLRIRRSFWRSPMFGLAAAAAIIFCIGLGVWRIEKVPEPTAGPTSGLASALTVSFAQDLVIRHDACCALPDHHDLKGVPDDDFRLMTQKLRETLGFPALAVAAGDGWTFYGASAICMVGQAHSAHLVFKQDGEALSLFSVAVASVSWPDGKAPVDGQRFSNTQDGHPIISWVHDNTVYSVVGSSVDHSLNLQGISPIADHMRLALSVDVPESLRTTVALQ